MLLNCFFLMLSIFSFVQSTPTPEIIPNKLFEGEYNSQQNIKLFQYLDVQTGRIDMTFIKINKSSQIQTLINQVIVQLFNPEFKDDKSIRIVIELKQFNINATVGWFQDKTKINITKYYKSRQNFKFFCQVSQKIVIINDQNKQDIHKVKISLQLKSQNNKQCNFKISGQLGYYDDKLQSILYSIFVSCVTFIQLIITYTIIKNHNNGRILTQKISLMTISMCTIQDFFHAMTHIYFLIFRDNYIYFLLPILLLIVQSIFFDMRLLFIVWRVVNMQLQLSTSQFRKRLTMFYVKFYLSLVAYIALMYFFFYQMWIFLLQPIMLYLPQIIKNIRKGNSSHFYATYFLGLLDIKFFLPLYIRGCPKNIFLMTPSILFCIIWSFCFLFFIIILYFQQKLGSRFFIPNKCIFNQYEYKFMFTSSTNVNEDIPECSICLIEITQRPQKQSNVIINTSLTSQLILKQAPIQVMRTPCMHLFHQQCLKSWINIKLQCPSCKSQLPPFDS